MQRTEHYNLSKPEREDPFRAQDVADNLDAIDEAIHNAAESGTASVDGMDIRPASVTATGDVADGTGTLDAVRQAAKDAGNITGGTLPIAHGGTGGGTVAAALAALGIAPVVLFNGDSNGNITLAQSAANFARMTIYFHDNDGQCNSVELYGPNGKTALLFSSWQGRWNKVRSVRISGTTITTNYAAQTDANDNHTDSSNLVYISKILGWKF